MPLAGISCQSIERMGVRGKVLSAFDLAVVLSSRAVSFQSKPAEWVGICPDFGAILPVDSCWREETRQSIPSTGVTAAWKQNASRYCNELGSGLGKPTGWGP